MNVVSQTRHDRSTVNEASALTDDKPLHAFPQKQNGIGRASGAHTGK